MVFGRILKYLKAYLKICHSTAPLRLTNAPNLICMTLPFTVSDEKGSQQSGYLLEDSWQLDFHSQESCKSVKFIQKMLTHLTQTV